MDYDEQFFQLINNALKEDVGDGDHSTLACIDPAARGKAELKVKEAGIIAGVDVAYKIFRFVEPGILFNRFIDDGSVVKFGDIAFEVSGHVHTILKCERLVLNIMQRMSGIATKTSKYVDKISNYQTKLLDTRKTTPNFRLLEKEAVRIGGGTNHRFGLYDMIMLKDNHIDYCGGIEKAIYKAYDYKERLNPALKIEVEARSLKDVEIVLKTGKADRIMLDNFSPDGVKQALALIQGKLETEASGGVTFDNIEAYAATGVDFISSGAIIHQAVSLDLSLKAVMTN